MRPINYLSLPGIIVMGLAAISYYVVSITMDVLAESNGSERIFWAPFYAASLFVCVGLMIWCMDIKIKIDVEEGREKIDLKTVL